MRYFLSIVLLKMLYVKLFRWFSEQADKTRAEELLNTVREDGAFLIRYSGTDKNVFVLSLRFVQFSSGRIIHFCRIFSVLFNRM